MQRSIVINANQKMFVVWCKDNKIAQNFYFLQNISPSRGEIDPQKYSVGF